MADNQVFTNNASALLAASVIPADTTIQVAAGFGALFPSPTGGQFFYATLVADTGDIEIVKCTSRTGDNLTVVRAQDGTTAQSFTLNVTRVELRIVAISLTEFLQKNGGTMTGGVDFNQQTLTDAFIQGVNTRFTAGQIAGVPLRGAVDLSSNEINVPSGGGRATAGGAEILVRGDDLIPELDVAGIINLSSATVGVRLANLAYFRVHSTDTDYYQFDTSDGDGVITAVNIPTIRFSGADIEFGLKEIRRAVLRDVAIGEQSVSATASTSIVYDSGSYVKLSLVSNITTFAITSPPTEYAFVRLKITQGTGGQTITWPANYKWPGGVAPALSTAAGAIDYVDLWTDDFGVTWYGAYNNNWQ